MDEYMYGHQRFVSGPNGMRNYFTFCARGLDFPGEVRSKEWVWTEIAKRLGDDVVEGYNPRMKDVAVRTGSMPRRPSTRRPSRSGPTTPPSWPISALTIVPPGRSSTPIRSSARNRRAVITRSSPPWTRVSPFNTPQKKDRVLLELREDPRYDREPLAGASTRCRCGAPATWRGDIGSASNDGFYNPKVKDYPLCRS